MSVATIVKFAAKSFTLPSTCVRLRGMLDDPKSDNSKTDVLRSFTQC